jgi:hypothetical protein
MLLWIPVLLLYALTLAGGALVLCSALSAEYLRRRRREALRRRLEREQFDLVAWRARKGRLPRQPGRDPLR